MAANNYFGFTHGGTQYATATGYQPAPQPTAGYAVPPATYTTPRAAATAYDVASYQTAAATQSAYAKAAYNSAAYDTRQNAYAQQTYPTQPQYAPYQAVTTYTTGVVPKKQCQANAAAYATSSAMQQKVTYPIQSTTVTPNQATTNKAPAVPGYEAVYSNTNFPTQNQNQVRPNNVQKRQNWFKKLKSTTGFAGAAKGSSNRLGFTNRSQEIHYCDVCRISCAGTQTYKEHLDGQKHKKREANSKLTPTTVGKPSSNPATKVFHCDLCDISCTGADSYAAHLRGSKHQKVYNLHTKLGKPIPPPCFETAAVPKVAATPKVNFVPSGKLGTVAPKVEPNISPVVTIKTTESKTLPPAVTTISTGETDVLLVGMEYIEEIKDDTGKMVSFNCKLCECKFNDPNAKEMHMKGRRHRLSYKKKVDPSLVVELKPSWFEARRMQKDKQHDGSRLRDDRSNFWSDRFMDMEDRYSWDDRRRYQEEVEYYDWCRTMGPRNMGMGPPGLFGPPAMIGGVRPPPPHLLKFAHGMRPQMHNSMRRYDTVDDKHIMAKHSSLFPKQNSLKTLQKAISDTEKALKLAAEDLVKIVPEVVLTDPETQVTETNEINNDQAKKTAKEDGRDGSMFTFTTEKDDTKVTKIMTGSMRVGALSKGLLLINENEVDLIIICSVPPTVALLNSIVMVLPDKLKIVAKDDTYIVNKHEADAKLTVETNVEDEKFIVNVTLTSPSVREAILVTAEGENQQTEPVAIVPGEHVLDKTKCLEALAAIRHAKWFQARLAIIPNGPLIIRILKDFIIREPKWHPLTPWMLELLVERVLTSTYAANSPNAAAGLSPAESLRRFFEAVASGALLPGIVGVHLIDPCEKEPVDALAPLTLQQRESITVSAQNALRLITFRQVNKVLGMEMLPIKQQRFTRKRRREGSAGEGNETEDAGENKKKDKKEDDSVNQNQANDVTDNGDGMSNGLVANVETEKIDIK